MKAWRKIILASVVAISLLIVSYSDVFRYMFQKPVHLPQDIQTLLENADTFTLFSVKPEPDFDRKSTNTFEGHEILGQLKIQSQGTRTELVNALNDGISAEYRHKRPGETLALPSCFNPRHGIRAKKGDATIEFLICFECRQIYITYIPPRSATNQLFLTTSVPAATFNEVLKDAGVPLPVD